MVGPAPGLGVALAAYAVLGLANVAAQLLVPAAAQLADDTQRGRAVATVISGLLTGMLLARTISGLATEYIGWRRVWGAERQLQLEGGGGGTILTDARSSRAR